MAALSVADDRHDVPCFSMCFAAYRNARKGTSFSDYTGSLEFARAAGAPVPRSRQSRMTAAQLVNVFGQTLRAEDTSLLRTATHIHLTMDARHHSASQWVFVRTALPTHSPDVTVEWQDGGRELCEFMKTRVAIFATIVDA